MSKLLDTFYQTLETKFEHAVKSGALKYTQATESNIRSHNPDLHVHVSFVPSLAKKPSAKDSKAEPQEKPKSPWLPPEEELHVASLNNYNVVLNKFAVAKYHFMLVTKDFERQETPLSEDDFENSLEVLTAADSQSGKRHFAFYNSGPNSGGSVAHKHIQFLTAPENFRLFPDTTQGKLPMKCVADDRVPFANYIIGFDSKPTPEEMALAYSEVLGRCFTNLSQERLPISYSLVFTKEWIMAVPRCTSKVEDLDLNALATIGLLLAKTEKDVQDITEKRFDLVKSVGFPYEPVVRIEACHTGFTNY